uniref:Uncharacterized protein n=1 Tax=Arundo donax TaxID=35708 RepID=A0A0A9AAF2_ARUDO
MGRRSVFKLLHNGKKYWLGHPLPLAVGPSKFCI